MAALSLPLPAAPQISAHAICRYEALELLAGAIEDVDVNFSLYSGHASVGRELPEEEDTALVLYLVAGDCILKPLFARPRPCDVNTAITILVKRPHGHSFPSGHTASAFAAAFALWLQNRKLGVPALVLAAFIAFTRLYLYVHFPTDVLGGLVLGLALGALASWLVDSLANKSKKKQSV